MEFPCRGMWHVWRNRRYLGVIKLVNMAAGRLELALRRERLVSLPHVYKVESTNCCNGTCRLCPTGQGIHGRAKGKITYEQFHRIVDRIKSVAYTLDVSNWGEPLLVKDIYKMVRYAHDAGIWTYLSSNMHAYTMEPDEADRLVNSGLDMLNCSIHGTTQDTFEQYQPGKKLDLVLRNIRTVLDARRRLKSLTPGCSRVFCRYEVQRASDRQVQAACTRTWL